MNSQTRANLLPTGSFFNLFENMKEKVVCIEWILFTIMKKNDTISDNVSSIAQKYLDNLVQFIFYTFYNPTPEVGGQETCYRFQILETK